MPGQHVGLQTDDAQALYESLGFEQQPEFWSLVVGTWLDNDANAMSLTQYYTATTLDGFIADPDDSLEWLFTRDQDHEGPLNYGAFIADVGALAMGSTTYEWILEPRVRRQGSAEWKWPYDIPCWVFTHRELTVVPGAQVVFTSDRTSAPCTQRWSMRPAGRTSGSRSAAISVGQFADVGLLDEVIVYIAPVTLGRGKPLLARSVELRLEETRAQP